MTPAVLIYTDGACRGNPGPGGWGAVMIAGKHRKEICGGDLATTNNRMELMAAISALEAMKRPCLVELHTDSQYVKNGITDRSFSIERSHSDSGMSAVFEQYAGMVPAEVLALNQAVQVILLWSDRAFGEMSPLAAGPGGEVMLRPEIAALIRAGYDPVLPAMAMDATHGLRLAARIARVV
jgi:hypothetical protein